MRTHILICASFLLALCVSAQQQPPKKTPQKASDKKGGEVVSAQHGPLQNNDSTPIIISDGSIHVKHGKPNKDFSKAQLKGGEINLADYSPNAVGYLCDPSLYRTTTCTPSTAICATGTLNTTECKVDVSTAKSWSLSLCETVASCPVDKHSTIDLKWKASDKTKIKIASHKNNLRHKGANANDGGELIHDGADHLKSATLVVKPQSGSKIQYTFDAGDKHLFIGYNCSSGNC